MGDHGEPGRDVVADTLWLEVRDEHDGARLDHCITAVLPERSRSQIQRLIRDGHVRLNQKLVRASHAVHTGDVIDLEIPAPVPSTPVPRRSRSRSSMTTPTWWSWTSRPAWSSTPP